MNWRRFFNRDETDAEQRAELDFYLDKTTEEYIQRGMEPAVARAAARRKLGNTTLIREEVFRMNALTLLEGVLRPRRILVGTALANGPAACTAGPDRHPRFASVNASEILQKFLSEILFVTSGPRRPQAG